MATGSTPQRRARELGPLECTTAPRSEAPASATWSSSEDDVVLVETRDERGARARVVFSTRAPVDVLALDELCTAVGWPRRPPAKVAAALAHSYLVASLHLHTIPEESSSGDTPQPLRSSLVGLARATSDHAFNATIWDVLVSPDFQGLGLGKALVERLTRALLARDIANVSLFADASVVTFYKEMGFEVDPEGIKGMFYFPPPRSTPF